MALRHILRTEAVTGLFLVGVLMLWPTAVQAAEGHAVSEPVFLLQVLALLVCGRLVGELMHRIGQPAVMGQLIAGILLGPSVLGALFPDLEHALFPAMPEQRAMIDAIAQLGILMLLLLTGMETDLSVVRRSRQTAFCVSIAGIALPFACGLGLGLVLPDELLPDPGKRFITALFLGTALSISSVKIVAAVVREVGFLRRTVGQVIVASAIIDDTIGWILMAVTFGLALHGAVDVAGVTRAIAGTAAFLAVSFTLGRRVVFRLILWANDSFESEMPVITMILLIMGVMALITDAIGVHTVLGAFVAGILVGQSPNLTRHIDTQLRGLIVALFMPVFFGLAGLSTNLAALAAPEMLMLTVALIGIASLGKFAGAFLGGRLGTLTWAESLAVGCGMNARGSTEVIIATLGLSMGALSQNLFTSIVAMAVVTTMSMPPMLRWALARLQPSVDERARLEREALEAQGFVAQIERLLVAVDGSPSGQLASRLTGLLAGVRRITTTVLHFDASSAATSVGGNNQAKRTQAAVEQSASVADQASIAELRGDQVDITTRVERPTEAAIVAEARKGYGLLLIGREPAAEGDGFQAQIARSAAAFGGPFAIAIARGNHRKRRARSGADEAAAASPLHILVPVDGTEASRKGAELAVGLTQASGGVLTALHVYGRARRGAGDPRLTAATDSADAVLRDVVQLGSAYGVDVTPTISRRTSIEDAILRALATGAYDLLVMGVNPRPGDRLFFGHLAAALIERAECSILFVAPTPFVAEAEAHEAA